MRFLPRALVACGTGFAVSLLAACGGGAGLLSGDQANSLSNRLDQVGAAVSSRNCAAAVNAAQAFNNAVSNLPGTINTTLRSDLDQGGSTVQDLASRQCHQTTATTTPTASTATSTTSTSTTSTSTPTTTTSTTSTTQPTTTTETQPTTTGTTPTNPSGGGGLGGGGGNGGGNGQ